MKIFGLKNCDKCCLAATVLDVANITDVKRIQIPDEILLEHFLNLVKNSLTGGQPPGGDLIISNSRKTRCSY